MKSPKESPMKSAWQSCWMPVRSTHQSVKQNVYKALVLTSLLVVGVVYGTASYLLLKSEQKKSFKTDYNRIADDALDSVASSFSRASVSNCILSSVIGQENANASAWPHVVLPNYATVANDLMRVTPGTMLAYAPLVRPEEVADFETYAYEFFDSNPSHAPNVGREASFGEGIYFINDSLPDTEFHDTTGETSYNSAYQILAPILQMPNMSSTIDGAAVMLNLHRDESIGRAMDSSLMCAEGGITGADSCASLAPFLSESVIDYLDIDRCQQGPDELVGITQPIFPAGDSTEVVGFTVAVISVTELLSDGFHETINGIDCVVSLGSRTVTFNIVDGEAVLVGEGDRHQSSMDEHARMSYLLEEEMLTRTEGEAAGLDTSARRRRLSTDADAGTSSNVERFLRGMEEDMRARSRLLDEKDLLTFKVTVYPQASFTNQYYTALPVAVSIFAAFLMVLCALLFLLYDGVIQREAINRDMISDTRRRFVRFISHEVRTPLNVMQLGLDTIRSEMQKARSYSCFLPNLGCSNAADYECPTIAVGRVHQLILEWIELMDNMIESSDSAVIVLDSLLNYDQIEESGGKAEVQELQIWELISSIHDKFSPAAKKKNISFVLEGTAFSAELEKLQKGSLDCLHVVGIKDKLMNIFNNLIESALKFTPQDGRIVISADWVEDGLADKKVYLPEHFIQPRGGSIRVRVSDSGRGLTKKELRTIAATEEGFKANKLQFGQADGLSIYLVKTYTEYHGGELRVTSRGVGKGSVFEVELPLFKCPVKVHASDHHFHREKLTCSIKGVGRSLSHVSARLRPESSKHRKSSRVHLGSEDIISGRSPYRSRINSEESKDVTNKFNSSKRDRRSLRYSNGSHEVDTIGSQYMLSEAAEAAEERDRHSTHNVDESLPDEESGGLPSPSMRSTAQATESGNSLAMLAGPVHDSLMHLSPSKLPSLKTNSEDRPEVVPADLSPRRLPPIKPTQLVCEPDTSKSSPGNSALVPAEKLRNQHEPWMSWTSGGVSRLVSSLTPSTSPRSTRIDTVTSKQEISNIMSGDIRTSGGMKTRNLDNSEFSYVNMGTADTADSNQSSDHHVALAQPAKSPPSQSPQRARSSQPSSLRGRRDSDVNWRETFSRNSKHILVVDDVASCRKMLVRILKNDGHTCEEAKDGRDCIQKYNDAIQRVGGKPFDIMLLDSEMPVMTGPEAAKQLRADDCKIPIIGVTGNVLPADVDRFLACGATAVLPKPLKLDRLYIAWESLDIINAPEQRIDSPCITPPREVAGGIFRYQFK